MSAQQEHGQVQQGDGPLRREPARRSLAARFFGVIAESRTWLSAVYLFLSFPLGLVYFVFLVTGTALGVGLVILWVGIPILLVVMAACWVFAAFERRLADALLGTQCGPSPRPWELEERTLARISAALSHPATWKGIAFVIIKFPLGLLSFVIVVGLAGVVDVLLTAPFWAAFSTGDTGLSVFGWHPEHWYTALPLLPLGLLVLFIGLHLLNALAEVWRLLVKALLVEQPPATMPPMQMTGLPMEMTGRPMEMTGQPMEMTGQPRQAVGPGNLVQPSPGPQYSVSPPPAASQPVAPGFDAPMTQGFDAATRPGVDAHSGGAAQEPSLRPAVPAESPASHVGTAFAPPAGHTTCPESPSASSATVPDPTPETSSGGSWPESPAPAQRKEEAP